MTVPSKSHTYPDVKLARKEALWNSGRIQPSSCYVHNGHKEKPAHLAHSGGFYKAFCYGEMHGGDHTTQPQSQEHTYERNSKICQPSKSAEISNPPLPQLARIRCFLIKKKKRKGTLVTVLGVFWKVNRVLGKLLLSVFPDSNSTSHTVCVCVCMCEPFIKMDIAK